MMNLVPILQNRILRFLRLGGSREVLRCRMRTQADVPPPPTPGRLYEGVRLIHTQQRWLASLSREPCLSWGPQTHNPPLVPLSGCCHQALDSPPRWQELDIHPSLATAARTFAAHSVGPQSGPTRASHTGSLIWMLWSGPRDFF